MREGVEQGVINPDDIDSVRVRFDEHTTATDGCYELHEVLEQELKYGTFNAEWDQFSPPLFPHMRGGVEVSFRDSSKDALIRASDIVANVAFGLERKGDGAKLSTKLHTVRFP